MSKAWVRITWRSRGEGEQGDRNMVRYKIDDKLKLNLNLNCHCKIIIINMNAKRDKEVWCIKSCML